jgi:hypothetical protein
VDNPKTTGQSGSKLRFRSCGLNGQASAFVWAKLNVIGIGLLTGVAAR